MLPWEWVVDEHRTGERVPSWDDPEDFARSVVRQYRRDRWITQPRQVEIWSEKGTIRGTLAPILSWSGVTLRVMHGYSSATIVHKVAEWTSYLDKPLLVFYIGDWDPSGMHMSEVDLPRRLEDYGGKVSIRRLALTDEDIWDGQLPSFPAEEKQTDARYQWFVERYGQTCWELDALSPAVLRARLEAALFEIIDREEWQRCMEAEEAEQRSLKEVLNRWSKTA